MTRTELAQLIGRRLREERRRAGFERGKDFADALGVSAPQLSRIEKGERNADSGMLRHAAALLEVPMETFFEEDRAELVLTRTGGAKGDGMQVMIDWALELRRDLDRVADFTLGDD